MIRGLLDRALPPRLGVIALGIKEVNDQGKEFPREVEYFVLPGEVPGVPPRPTRLDVMLPADDPDKVFPTAYVLYNSARVCTWLCDGRTYTSIPMEGERTTGGCLKTPGEPCECKATPKGRLSVVLLNGPVGIYQVVIGGERRCASLMKQLVLYRSIFGRLTGLVFRLERVPTQTQITNAKGKRLSRTGYPVHLLTDLVTREALAIRAAEEHLALPAGMVARQLGEGEGAPDDDEAAAATGADDAPPVVVLGQPEEWTIERLYREAKAIGIEAPAYKAVLTKLYGNPDNLTERAMADQRDALERALRDEGFAGRLAKRCLALAAGAEVRR